MRYGSEPKDMGLFDIEASEMMFYQYLPIKLAGGPHMGYHHLEPRLYWLTGLVGACACDFVGLRGLDEFNASYVYLTAKHLWQVPGCSFNRTGWHSDGFLTDDVNYIWSNCVPTVFNIGDFTLSLDDKKSLQQMAEQAHPDNNRVYNNKHLLRLTQEQIHKVGEIDQPVLRTFVKVSISRDKYDLKGNSVNPLLDYSWDMREREVERNVPQKL